MTEGVNEQALKEIILSINKDLIGDFIKLY